MPIIKNIGKRDRMVADRILRPGEAKYISQKQAKQFEGIPDFEIVDETPKSNAAFKIQKDEVTLQAKPEVVSAPVRLRKRKGAASATVIPPAPTSAKVKKSRREK